MLGPLTKTEDISMLVPVMKTHPNAKLPRYQSMLASGADLHACLDEPVEIRSGSAELIPTGIAIELPEGIGAFLIPRSGLGHKCGIVLGNLVGLIDADYRAEIMVSLWNRRHDDSIYTVNPGDRIAQLVLIPTPRGEFIQVSDLSTTQRGHGGFGSTGR